MNEELQETPQKSNKIAIIISAVIVVLVILLIFLVYGNSKDETSKVNTQTYTPSNEQIELTEQQRTEKEEKLKSIGNEQVELTQEQKQNKKALLESILNQ